MTDRFNEMIILGQDKKSKKGDGINAALKLMQDLRDFQGKVDTCVEAQMISENKAKIEQFNAYVDKMYNTLLEIASGGIRAIRNGQEPVEEEVKREVKVEKTPVMVNVPQVPKM